MPTAGASAPSAAFQPISGTIGSWMWMTSKSPLAQLAPRQRRPRPRGTERLETAPLGRDAHRAAERDQVVGDLARLGVGAVRIGCGGREGRPGRARARDGRVRETPRQAPRRACSRLPDSSRNMARQGQFARKLRVTAGGARAARLGPGVADEGQQEGRPITSTIPPESLARAPSRTAATAPSRPARIAGPAGRSQPATRSRRSTAQTTARRERRQTEEDRSA